MCTGISTAMAPTMASLHFVPLAGVLAAYIWMFAAGLAAGDNHLVVRVPAPIPTSNISTNYTFVTLPRTQEAIKKVGFALAQFTPRNPQYTLWCKNKDYRMCLMFDRKGSVAGLQVSIAVADAQKSPVKYATDSYWIPQTILGQRVYSGVALFVKPSVLAAGGRKLTEETATAPDGLFFKKADNTYVRGPLNEELATGQNFVKQGCFITQGLHYLLQFSATTPCENLRPWALLYKGAGPTNKLNGYAVFQFGDAPARQSTWFEYFPKAFLPNAVPNRPECLKDFVDKYQISSIHVHFIENPKGITC